MHGNLCAHAEVPPRYECDHRSSFQAALLVFHGHFKNYDTSPSPRILSAQQHEMIQFTCEDVPVLFYVNEDAKTLLSRLSRGNELKIQGQLGALLEGQFSIVTVYSIDVVS